MLEQKFDVARMSFWVSDINCVITLSTNGILQHSSGYRAAYTEWPTKLFVSKSVLSADLLN